MFDVSINKQRKVVYKVSKTFASDTDYISQPIASVLPNGVFIFDAYVKVLEVDSDEDSKYSIYIQTGVTRQNNSNITEILQTPRNYDTLGVTKCDGIPLVLALGNEINWVRFSHSNGNSSAKLELYLTIYQYNLNIGDYF